jgi:hypothetical protein
VTLYNKNPTFNIVDPHRFIQSLFLDMQKKLEEIDVNEDSAWISRVNSNKKRIANRNSFRLVSIMEDIRAVRNIMLHQHVEDIAIDANTNDLLITALTRNDYATVDDPEFVTNLKSATLSVFYEFTKSPSYALLFITKPAFLRELISIILRKSLKINEEIINLALNIVFHLCLAPEFKHFMYKIGLHQILYYVALSTDVYNNEECRSALSILGQIMKNDEDLHSDLVDIFECYFPKKIVDVPHLHLVPSITACE